MKLAAHIREITRDGERLRDLMRAREQFFDAMSVPSPTDQIVRSDVLCSWKRSRENGVERGGVTLPRPSSEQRAQRLARVAAPVLSRLQEQLVGTDVWATLIDHDGVQVGDVVGERQLVERARKRGAVSGASYKEALAGTNGPGTALECLRPFVAVGPEHYRDAETGLVTVGIPIRDLTNRLTGVLAMACRLESADGLLVAYADDVADRIRDRLVDDVIQEERELLQRFRGAWCRPSQAAMIASQNIVVANAAARQLVLSRDNPDAIAAALLDAVLERDELEIALETSDEPLVARVKRIRTLGGEMGVLATFLSSRSRPSCRDNPRERVGPHQRLRRARASGLPTLVYGEPGSGKLTLVEDAIADEGIAWVTDSRLLTLDPQGWIAELSAACGREHTVIVRHLADLPEEFHLVFRAIVEKSSAWCVMTSTVSPSPETILFGIFSVIVERTPLRDRRDELGDIVRRMLIELGMSGTRCRPEVIAFCARHDWPGNLAQLRRVLASAATRSANGEISLEHLPPPALAAAAVHDSNAWARHERELVFRALVKAQWNREQAARLLGISRATIYRRIRQYAITVPTSGARAELG
jgi:transcriptional regulator of acetoin/glycerol metabolism